MDLLMRNCLLLVCVRGITGIQSFGGAGAVYTPIMTTQVAAPEN